MEKETLRKVQLTMLEILEEVKRVCDENGIKYVLAYGTCLGAIRHKGFIPWDDDLDIGMLREDYDKFCRIAPTALNPKYSFQEWNLDGEYALPFAKVRKNGTIYQEAKSKEGGHNGIFIDVFPYDNTPEASLQVSHRRKLYVLERIVLMKCGYRPWMEGETVLWKKRLFYIPFQIVACFASKKTWVKIFDRLAKSIDAGSGNVNSHSGGMTIDIQKREYFENRVDVPFETGSFPVPMDYHGYLTTCYGDYMQLPPEDQRENRHQVQIIDFGEDETA